MPTLVTILHVLVCIFLMLTVLLQAGKGGGMGAAFGGGTSAGTVFGGSGAGNFLRKLTVAAATIFMITSMVLAYLGSATGEDSLKRYSAQQRKAAAAKQAEHERALEGTTPLDPAGEADVVPPPEGTVDEGDLEEGMIDDPAEDEPADLIEPREELGDDTELSDEIPGAVAPRDTAPAETAPAEAAPAEDEAGDTP